MVAADRYAAIGIVAVVVAIVAIAGLAVQGTHASRPISNQSAGRAVQIVAAENFWGSLMQQIGGSHVNVTSIVTDPNADPHEYQSSIANAREIAKAQIIVVNGAGYDDWALKLVSAENSTSQTVLDVASLLGMANGTNPHFWYNPSYVNATVKQMYTDLVKTDPADASYYLQRYEALNASLAQVDSRISDIRRQFAGTRVAATESIFVYLANATGLDLVSPPEFMNAVSEGVDPPAQSVVQFENQIESGNVSVLVYNEQTVNPLTQQMKQIASLHNVTVVGVTENIQPPDSTFQAWMTAELLNLQSGLSANVLER